jgi:acetyltransferase-like isoleucine patch superfamily enzyme
MASAMKNRLIHFLVITFSLIVPWRLLKKLNTLKAKAFSRAISKCFKSSGSNFYIGNQPSVTGMEHISVGNNVQIFDRVRLEAVHQYHGSFYEPKITIGNNVSINFDCHIAAISEITIGDDVLIGSKVLIIDHDHGDISDVDTPPRLRPLKSKGKINIEKNVWVGEGVAILGGVTIGKNSIVACNSVVTRSLPSNSVAAGIPARVISISETGNQP